MVNSLSACGNTGNEYGVVILFGGGGVKHNLAQSNLFEIFALRGGGEPKSQKIARALHERSCNSTSARAARALVQKVTSHQSEIIHFLFFTLDFVYYKYRHLW